MDTEFIGLNIIFTEFYYWVTVVMMFLIHVGFCTYEVGVSRRKNHMTTLMKNAMVIPVRQHRLLPLRLVVLLGHGQRPRHHRRPRRGSLRDALERADGRPYGRHAGRHRDARRGRHRLLGAAERRLLGGLPAVLLDHRLDRLRLDHRAGEVGRLLADRRHARLGAPGSSTRPGAGTRPAGWCSCSATTTPMPRASCMRSPAAPASRC